MTFSLAVATAARFPDLDRDGPRLLAALEACGVDARPVVWDREDCAGFDAVLVRSTWDYTHKLPEYLTWVESLPLVLNPASMVRWNSDKHYLADLAGVGVPVTPTTFVAAGDTHSWEPAGEDVVVKPVVSASAQDTARFDVGSPQGRRDADRLLAAIHASGRAAMVQPYLAGVEVHGEASLVFFDGTYSHAARKEAILTSTTVEPAPHDEEEALTEVDDDALAVGRAALAAVEARFGVPLYARVDLLPTPTGPVVLELELIEPSLWLHAPGAPERFASAVRRRLENALARDRRQG